MKSSQIPRINKAIFDKDYCSRFDTNEGLAYFRKFSLWFIKQKAKEIYQQLNGTSGKIVEIGSGPGYLLLELSKILPSKYTFYGVDIDEGMLEFAQKHTRRNAEKIRFIRNGSYSLPFKDNSVSMVISENSMHHWDQLNEMLKEILRILTPGGTIIIFDFDSESKWYAFTVSIISHLLWMRKIAYKSFGKYFYTYYVSLLRAYSKKELSVALNDIACSTYEMETKRMTLKLRITKPSISAPN